MTPLRFNFSGWTDDNSGYGKANIHLMESLEKLTNGGISVEWERKICSDPEHMVNYTQAQKDVLLKPFTLEKIGIIQSTPNWFKNIHNDYKIGWSMIENNHIGKKWVNFCNEMDHIFVPSAQLVPIFQKYKVTKPITVIPEGYDPEEHKYIDRPKRDIFTFLTVGWMDERKNWDTMVQAFMSEFEPDEPVRFLIKNTCPHFGYQNPIDKRIRTIDHYLTPDELQKLYGMADCFLFPTRGEGFGMPIVEAMATGLPTVLTNWLGASDLCDERYNYPIDPIDISYRYFRPEQQGFMANIDPAELMYWMRHIYEHQDEAREKGKLASEWVKNNWTWDHAAQKIINVVEEISKTLPSSWKDPYEFSFVWDFETSSDSKAINLLERYKDKEVKFLQIGAYEGRFTLWLLHHILTNPKANIVDIDPWISTETYLTNGATPPLSLVEKRYHQNIFKNQDNYKVTTIRGKSEEELLKLTNQFDFIFVDGSHLAQNVIIDAEEALRLCKSGGVILFDDYMWKMGEEISSSARPHEAINEFLVNHMGEYKIIYKDYQLAIEKL
ncbi:MAG: hypothetical protein KCHDKBKB_00778 [Elusimicrobia bacterium]|nr:hypothetical protein [Elusimicrobiota bacterium]